MQRLSHRSRAFITNAGGLKAFIAPTDLPRFFEIAGGEKLEEAIKHQHIDMRAVIKELKIINSDG